MKQVPRVSKTHISLAVLFIKSKGHEQIPKNNVNLPSFYFPIDNPNYLLYMFTLNRSKLGGDWRDTHKVESSRFETWLYLDLDSDTKVFALMTPLVIQNKTNQLASVSLASQHPRECSHLNNFSNINE